MIEILTRFMIGSLCLGFAAYTDLKTRTAPNIIWEILLINAVGLTVIGIWHYNEPLWTILVAVILVILFYGLFQFNLINGGADTKALMCLAVLIPLFVIDVFLIASVIAVVSSVFMVHKGYTLRHMLTEYRYPFLAALFPGFVITFFLTEFWSVPLFQRVMEMI